MDGIYAWWKKKFKNYLKKYEKRDWLIVTEVRAQFFTKTHEKFLELILKEIIDTLIMMLVNRLMDDYKLMLEITDEGQKNSYEWIEKNYKDYYE